jgi:hypothetical protein
MFARRTKYQSPLLDVSHVSSLVYRGATHCPCRLLGNWTSLCFGKRRDNPTFQVDCIDRLQDICRLHQSNSTLSTSWSSFRMVRIYSLLLSCCRRGKSMSLSLESRIPLIPSIYASCLISICFLSLVDNQDFGNNVNVSGTRFGKGEPSDFKLFINCKLISAALGLEFCGFNGL